MMKILCTFPVAEWANGGISSWSRKFIKTFPNEEFELIVVNTAPRRLVVESGLFRRVVTGLSAMCGILKQTYSILKNTQVTMMHTTTSGNLGTLRDFLLYRLCEHYGVKTILHCHYGCIAEDYVSKGLKGWLLRKTVRLYDQIWVLDKRSLNALKKYSHLADKVFLTPNSIEVPSVCDSQPKVYQRVGFIGNVVPEKGVLELVQAVVALKGEARLDIVGHALPGITDAIKAIAKEEYGKSVVAHDRMDNAQVVAFMKELDIVALPTYYPSEAFPISILEAMSLGKVVISTHRAAIPDMLTTINGELCGILVQEKSVTDIIEALKWCRQHPMQADEMCQKAYEKVYNCYRTEVVYELYRSLYRRLV